MATAPRPQSKAPAGGMKARGAIAASMTKPGMSHRRQKRMGPAPFASFEDLSDELESPDDKNASNVVRLPGIREDATPCSPAPSAPGGSGEIRAEFIYTGISLLGAPSTPTLGGRTPIGEPPTSTTTTTTTTTLTPRIDISRASSGSQHDSREDTPEKEASMPGLEEGLRTSTEELASKGAHSPHSQAAPPHQPPPAPPPHDQQLHEDSYHSHNRKDSQSSDIGLLCISGRTSRLSSIGSQGSAQSRVSNASHLSVISGASRSPSPHKMLLETSFCGAKPKGGQFSIDLFEGKDGEEGTKALERALLQRQHDPTQVLIAEGVDLTPQSPRSIAQEPDVVVVERQPKAHAKALPDQRVTIKIDTPAADEDTGDDIQRPKMPKHIVSSSGTEYIYIPLKGPLPEDPYARRDSNGIRAGKTKVRETKSASGVSSRDLRERDKRKSKSASPSPAMSRHYPAAGPSANDEPIYIRIRLKPDAEYEDSEPPTEDPHKPETLNLQSKFDEITVFASQNQPSVARAQHLTKESPKHKSPSPSLSRKSSFASIFRSRETISPESPTLPGRQQQRGKEAQRRSRSKSRDRGGGPSSTESIDSKGKSMFSLFSKPRKASSRQSLDTSPGPDLPNLEQLAQNTSKRKRSHYESPLQGESVRIPLHSPTYYESKSFMESFKTSSQDSQETVIEVKPYKGDGGEKGEADAPESGAMRQSSTSSENIVFSTKLGSNNDIFTTKLPKHQEIIETTTAIVEYVKERVSETDDDLFIRPNSKEPKERRMSSSGSGESRKFKLEKSKRVDSRDLIAPAEKVLTLTQSTSSSSYIHTISSSEQMRSPERETTPVKPPRDRSRERPSSMLQQQDSEDIAIIAKEKVKVAEEHCSSESEKEVDVEPTEVAQALAKEDEMQEMEPERKGLVLQQDSYEDELPYVPTTLPQERSMAVPIIPVKQRASIDVKTCGIERPRSSTPIKPTLDLFREVGKPQRVPKADKLKISLPKQDDHQPRRKSSETGAMSAPVAAKSDWFDFSRGQQKPGEESPPPLPPRGMQREWINFEEIPEKRKLPKRIQTIPSRGNIEVPETLVQAQENVIYTYVNPEDCKCECHERPAVRHPPALPAASYQCRGQHATKPRDNGKERDAEENPEEVLEDEMPLLGDDDDEASRRHVISEATTGTSRAHQEPTDEGNNSALRTEAPLTSDLGASGGSSTHRSTIISQVTHLTDIASTRSAASVGGKKAPKK